MGIINISVCILAMSDGTTSSEHGMADADEQVGITYEELKDDYGELALLATSTLRNRPKEIEKKIASLEALMSEIAKDKKTDVPAATKLLKATLRSGAMVAKESILVEALESKTLSDRCQKRLG